MFFFFTDEVLSDNVRASRIERDLEGKSLRKCLRNVSNKSMLVVTHLRHLNHTDTRRQGLHSKLSFSNDSSCIWWKYYFYTLDLTLLCHEVWVQAYNTEQSFRFVSCLCSLTYLFLRYIILRVSIIHVRVDARCGRVNKFLKRIIYFPIAELTIYICHLVSVVSGFKICHTIDCEMFLPKTWKFITRRKFLVISNSVLKIMKQ